MPWGFTCGLMTRVSPSCDLDREKRYIPVKSQSTSVSQVRSQAADLCLDHRARKKPIVQLCNGLSFNQVNTATLHAALCIR